MPSCKGHWAALEQADSSVSLRMNATVQSGCEIMLQWKQMLLRLFFG